MDIIDKEKTAPKNFELLTDAEWRSYCKKRWAHVSGAYLFMAFFFSLFCGGLSTAIGSYYPLAQPYKAYISGAVVAVVCITCAYGYYKRRKYYSEHYEKITSVSVTDGETGCTKIYSVVHLRYLNNPPIRLAITQFNHVADVHYDEVQFFYRRQILFLHDPETGEFFGYCPKCNELMDFKFIEYGVCPSCGKFFHYYDSH